MLVYYSGYGEWIKYEEFEDIGVQPVPCSYKEHRAGIFVLSEKNKLDIQYKKQTKVFSLRPCYLHSDGVTLNGCSEKDDLCFSLINSRSDDDSPFEGVLYTEDEIIEDQNDSEKKELNSRSETTYLKIIAALLACIDGSEVGFEKHPSFKNQTALIAKITEHYQSYSGLAKRTLEEKFAKAKKSIKDS